MLVKIPPKMSVSYFMGYLKGKSSFMIHDRHANLKYNPGNRMIWAERILHEYGWMKRKKNRKV